VWEGTKMKVETAAALQSKHLQKTITNLKDPNKNAENNHHSRSNASTALKPTKSCSWKNDYI
jgi:hypothetical protein